MDCRDLDALIEEVAAGDLMLDPAAGAHLTACERCRAMLELARRIHQELPRLAATEAPASFTASVLGRVRRARWRGEQLLDWGFNIAVAGGVTLAMLGVYLLINLSGLTAVTSDTSALMAVGLALVVSRVSAALPTYLAAAALLATALAAWWWAERQLTS